MSSSHSSSPGSASWFRIFRPANDDDASTMLEAVVAGERYGVIGHGTGGALAQSLAARGGVDAMVLLDAPHAEGVGDEDPRLLRLPRPAPVGRGRRGCARGGRRGLNDAIPTSTLGLLPGCGHDLTDEAAATIAPMILEYLRARYLKESHAEAHGHDADHAHDGVVRIQLERRPPWVDLEEDERDDWFVDEDEEAST